MVRSSEWINCVLELIGESRPRCDSPIPAFVFARICRFLATLPRKAEGAGVAIHSCSRLPCARAVNPLDDR
jgi:hypothetical protein